MMVHFDEELLGILAWMVRGCLKWQKDGLGTPEEVKKATMGYREEMDIIGEFINDCCVIADNSEVAKGDLYSKYVEWWGTGGEKPISRKSFSMRLKERGIGEGRTKEARVWKGIELRNAEKDDR